MKQYTKEEFDNFPVIDGRKQCPSGDYTLIRSFGERCRFGEWCRFGEGCSFGQGCSFGGWCSFGEGCSFGERCRFGGWCSFGERCSFGRWCSFGELCSFGKRCSFEEEHEANELPFVRINNIGSRMDGCYIYNFKKGIYVRSGCFFGTEQEFIEAVEKKHAGTKYETQYKLALQLAKATF